MKRIWTTICLIALLFSSLAFTLTSQTGKAATQYTILWTNIYGTPVNQTCYHLVQTSDGGYALQSTNQSYNIFNIPLPTPQALILKTDSAGNLLWTKSYPISTYRGVWGYGLIQTTDGGLALGYNNGQSGQETVTHVIKTDGNGNQIWEKLQVYHSGTLLLQSSDDGLIFGGTGDLARALRYPWLNKIDSSGNPVWAKTYISYNTSSDGSYLNGISQFNDGGYALFGASAGLNGLLIKIDSNGDELWHKIYTIFETFGSSITTSDDGFLVSNGPGLYGLQGLVKLDSSGNIQWNQTFGINISSFIQTDDDGYLVIGGNTLLKLDSSGNNQWSYTFTGTNLSGIIRCNDGSYAIAGTYSIGANTYSWLSKISLTPTPTPTPSPTPTPTPSPSPTPTPTLSPSPTPTVSPTPTPTPSPSPTPTPTLSPSPTPTVSPTPTPTPITTPTPSPTPSGSPTPTVTSTTNQEPAATVSPTSTLIPTPVPPTSTTETINPTGIPQGVTYGIIVVAFVAVTASVVLFLRLRKKSVGTVNSAYF